MVNFAYTALTNADLKTMAGFGPLENQKTLTLVRTKVADDGLQHVAKHPTLQITDPMDNKVSDARISVLARLPVL